MLNKVLTRETSTKVLFTALRLAGVAFAGYLLLSLSAHSVSVFLDVASGVIVLLPIIVICGLLKWRYNAPVPPLAYALGTPLGLFGVSLGLIIMFASVLDLLALAPATAVLLLTAFYGGVISGLGYLFFRPDQKPMPKIGIWSAILCTATLGLVTWVAVSGAPQVIYGASYQSMSMIALVVTLALITPSSNSILKRVTNANILVILILTVMGVIDLATIGAETNYANPEAYLISMSKIYLSINTGLLIYLLCIVWSIHSGDFDDLDFGRMNWHLVEAFSLIVLITISPPSLYHFLN